MGEKVSVITPCYNGESFIARFMDSLLVQTYNNIEFILINDGSTDKTEEIVRSYRKKFKDKNIDFIYIYQENAGQAAALNRGLKIFTGDYITWPDSDDFLLSDSIEKKVNFLRENPDCGLVRTDGYIVKEEDIGSPIGQFSKGLEYPEKDFIFKKLINHTVWIQPGAYLMRKEAFLECYPDRNIYISRAGQNYQMLLPATYNYMCGYINEPLYVYVERKRSHSRSYSGLDSEFVHVDELENIIINTLTNIKLEEKEYREIIQFVKKESLKRKLFISIKYNSEVDTKKYKNALKIELMEDINNLTDKNIILFGASTLGRVIYSLIKDELNIVYFSDNDKNKWGKYIDRVEIIPPNRLLELVNYKIIITSQFKLEISKQLAEMNLDQNIYYISIF